MALKWIDSTRTSSNYSTEIPIDYDGQQEVTWDTPYIMGIGMFDVYLNGVLQQKGVYIEKTPNSIEFVDADYTKAGDIVSIRYKNSGLNLGSIRVVSNYAELLAVNDAIYNEIALVSIQHKFYIYGDNGWEEFIVPFTTQNIGVLFSYEKQTITDVTQRTYRMNNISYPVDSDNLLVFVDGKKLNADEYTKVDQKTITLNHDLAAGSSTIEFMVANTDGWEDCYSHTVDYTYYSDGNIETEVIKYGLTVVKTTTYEYDTNDNVTKETINKGYKTIIKEYGYDSNNNVTGIIVTVNS